MPGCRCSASASATRCSAGRSASAPTSSATATAGSTSRCRIGRPARVAVTSHNHGFAVDAPLDRISETPYGRVEVSHVALNDEVVEGLRLLDAPAFSVQYHPEAAPGPHDADGLFDSFVALMESAQMSRHRRRRRASWSSAPDRSSSARPASSTTPVRRPAGCCAQEGLRVILVNSNPATIMTDPEIADATYIEPITPEVVRQIIDRERPDALLATLGGQTALNIAVALADTGVLEEFGVRLLGADIEAIRAGEDRQRFKQIVDALPIPSSAPRARARRSRTRWRNALRLPRIWAIRSWCGRATPSAARAAASPTTRRSCAPSPADGAGSRAAGSQVLLEESILGWKEFELELMRDRADNVVVVCSIENVDPMGVHTGDSVTVAPAMTLTDREYQRMRDVAIAIMRAVGVDAGGCNIQFAVEPTTGRLVVIEMNPRVSRSSALASKATGFPIAKISAKLALGYTLDEIANDITRVTPAAFEPSLDYVVVKVPRFAFEKFPGADPVLTTHMKSVGEAMAIGRNFGEALNKALRSLETTAAGFWTVGDDKLPQPRRAGARSVEGAARGAHLHRRAGASRRRDGRGDLRRQRRSTPGSSTRCWRCARPATTLRRRAGRRRRAARRQAGRLLRPPDRRHHRTHRNRGPRAGATSAGIRPVFKTVDTCAAEFAAHTPYHYSCYDEESEVAPARARAVIVLGSGPNRIGQGIEFDYACCHAAFALSDAGYETVMVNCNPETVSTDYDTSDRLYFEPLTVEDVLEVVAAETAAGPARRASSSSSAGRPRSVSRPRSNGPGCRSSAPPRRPSTSPRTAANSARCSKPPGSSRRGSAPPSPTSEARAVAAEIGYPVLVRPSYVLGGRGMEIVYDETSLEAYVSRATSASPEHPILVDRFLDDAVEVDVDAIFDGTELYLAGVMEHIEEAGIHSGDSACALPPITLGKADLIRIRDATEAIARGVGVLGLVNVQYALQADVLYVLEANPRASRTVPFVAKATGVQVAKAASRVMLGATIAELRGEGMLPASGDGADMPFDSHIAVKEAVLPFNRFTGVDTVLGPEMKSTGEVMGIDGALRGRLRQEPERRLRPAADQGPGLRQPRQPRQARHDLPGETAGRPRLRRHRDRRHRTGAAPQRGGAPRSCPSTPRGCPATPSRASSPVRSTS